jgi:hypothetical protein
MNKKVSLSVLMLLILSIFGDVVRKSKVEYSGWMTEYQYPLRWSHKRFFE